MDFKIDEKLFSIKNISDDAFAGTIHIDKELDNPSTYSGGHEEFMNSRFQPIYASQKLGTFYMVYGKFVLSDDGNSLKEIFFKLIDYRKVFFKKISFTSKTISKDMFLLDDENKALKMKLHIRKNIKSRYYYDAITQFSTDNEGVIPIENIESLYIKRFFENYTSNFNFPYPLKAKAFGLNCEQSAIKVVKTGFEN